MLMAMLYGAKDLRLERGDEPLAHRAHQEHPLHQPLVQPIPEGAEAAQLGQDVWTRPLPWTLVDQQRDQRGHVPRDRLLRGSVVVEGPATVVEQA